MRNLISLFAFLAVGCESTSQYVTLSGSAYVESERPEGRAVAKIEVKYQPPASPGPREAREAIPVSAQRDTGSRQTELPMSW